MKDELFEAYRELQSERLLLREITEQDVDDVFEIYSNKEVMLYFADRFPFEKISEAETMIREYAEALSKNWTMRWGIVLKENGKLIGTCGFHAISDYDKRIEIGYDLNRDYWQKGIMTEALSLIIDHAFRYTDVNRIEAMIEPPNIGSRALLEKLGFQYEGTLRKHEMCRGDFVDIQMFSLLREDMDL
ncbi:MAG: GNAT family N-acetyltransferase [Clostridiales bacterium]|nr:GNAT family N-acetyltransferase [Clostridiales bacterium]